MKLYYSPGACSMASHIILNEMDMDYTLEKVDTSSGTTETGEDYKKTNPLGYVPALKLEDGNVILENSAMLPYLADLKTEAKLAPKGGTVARAKFYEALSFVSSELHKAYSPFFAEKDMTPERKEVVQSKLKSRLDYVEVLLGDGRPFLNGDDFSAADAYAFVVLNWSNFINFSLDNWPNVKSYQGRVGARPAVQRTLKEEGLAA